MAMPGPLGSILDPNYGFNFAPQTPQMQGTTGIADVQEAQGIAGQGVTNLGGLAGAATPYGMVNFGQMQGLENQLQAQSMGQGPNPAMAQLAMTTGQNVANQNALMAGQRGSAANTGMIARQAAQQGAGIQQQAVGQSALMKAQQQLAAQQQLQQQQQNIGQLTQGAADQFAQAGQNQYGALSGTYDTQNIANLQSQTNMLNNQYSMEQLRAKQQGQLVGGLFSGFGALGSMMGGMGGGGGSSGGGGGGGMSAMAAAHGGRVPQYAEGGPTLGVEDMPQTYQSPLGVDSNMGMPTQWGGLSNGVAPMQAPQQSALGVDTSGINVPTTSNPVASEASFYLPGGSSSSSSGKKSSKMNLQNPLAQDMSSSGPLQQQITGTLNPSSSSLVAQHLNGSPDASMGWGGGPLSGKASMLLMAKGGRVPAKISPGEITLSAQEASDPRRAAIAAKLKAMRGQKVPGKAKVAGDNLKNDTVNASLEQGGIVVPRTKANSKDAGKFAYAVAMRGKGKK